MIDTILLLVSGFTTLVGADFKQAQTVTDGISDSVNYSSINTNDVEAHTTTQTLPFSSSTFMISLPGKGDSTTRQPWYGSLTLSSPLDNPTTVTRRYVESPSQYEQRTKDTMTASGTTGHQVILMSSEIPTLPSLAEPILQTASTTYTTVTASTKLETSLNRELSPTSISAAHVPTTLEVQATTTSETDSSSGNTQSSTSLDRIGSSSSETKSRNDITSTFGYSVFSSTYNTLFSLTKSTIQLGSPNPNTEAPKSSAFGTAEVSTSLRDSSGISPVQSMTSEVSPPSRSELSSVVLSNTQDATTYGAASGTTYSQHSEGVSLTKTVAGSDISLPTQTIVEHPSYFLTPSATDSGAGTFTTPSRYISGNEESTMTSASYLPTSTSEVPRSSDLVSERSHTAFKEITPPTTDLISILNETSSGHLPISSIRLSDRPGKDFEDYNAIFETQVPSAASIPIIRPTVKFATSNSKFVENTSTVKSSEGTRIGLTVVSDPGQTSSGSSANANWSSMLPLMTVGSIAGSSELEPNTLSTQNRPAHGTNGGTPTTSSNPKTYSQPPKGNEQSSQGQQANTIGIATGAVSASVMCGIIVFLIARHYKIKRTHWPFSFRMLTNSSRSSLDSGTTSTVSSTTMNDRGHGWGSKPSPSHDRRNGSFDKRAISSPLSEGNSLGL